MRADECVLLKILTCNRHEYNQKVRHYANNRDKFMIGVVFCSYTETHGVCKGQGGNANLTVHLCVAAIPLTGPMQNRHFFKK